MLKAQCISDLTNRKTGRRKFFFCFRDQFFMNMLLCVLSGMHPKQVTQIIGREVHLSRKMLHREQARYVAVKVVGNQLLKPGQQR